LTNGADNSRGRYLHCRGDRRGVESQTSGGIQHYQSSTRQYGTPARAIPQLTANGGTCRCDRLLQRAISGKNVGVGQKTLTEGVMLRILDEAPVFLKKAVPRRDSRSE
jgi:hypothetical protein